MPQDCLEPEFTGAHPGVIIRGCPDLSEKTSTISFVPLTSTPPHRLLTSTHALAANPNPASNDPVWAVCTHIYTVRITRLERYYDGSKLVVPRVTPSDLTGIFAAIRHGFTAIRSHMEQQVRDLVAAEKALLEQEFDARLLKEVEAAVEAELERLTAPSEAGS